MRREQLANDTVLLSGSYEGLVDGSAAAGFKAVEFCLPQVKSLIDVSRTSADTKRVLDTAC